MMKTTSNQFRNIVVRFLYLHLKNLLSLFLNRGRESKSFIYLGSILFHKRGARDEIANLRKFLRV